MAALPSTKSKSSGSSWYFKAGRGSAWGCSVISSVLTMIPVCSSLSTSQLPSLIGSSAVQAIMAKMFHVSHIMVSCAKRAIDFMNGLSECIEQLESMCIVNDSQTCQS